MRNTRFTAIVIGLLTMLAIAGTLIGIIAYADSRSARINLLSKYFHALASKDSESIADLTSPDFLSTLPALNLTRGNYELFDFGSNPGDGVTVQRFLLVAPDSDGLSRAYLADMHVLHQGFINEISAIKLSETGTQIKK